MNELSDNELMLLVKAGEPDYMSQLFKRHYRSLYSFLFHMTHDKQASEDMVQNVFYRMLKYRNGYKPGGSFQTWMFHISRNVLKDNWKKRERTADFQQLDSISEQIGGGDKPDEKLEQSQQQNELYLAMEKLRKEDREILTLSKLQELSHNEISKILQINEGAVKVRVHRALNELKSIYLKTAAQ